jgi:CRP-like cAMP-binding protein
MAFVMSEGKRMNAPMDAGLAESKIAALGACGFFSGLDDDVLLRYVPYFEWLSINAEQVLIKEGDASDFAVVVVSGVFEISKGDGSKRKLMAFAKPGTMLGEMGLVTNDPRYATCKAVGVSEVGLLSREQFEIMKVRDSDLHSTLMSRIVMQLAKRLTQITDSIVRLKEKNDIAIEAARRILETSTQI